MGLLINRDVLEDWKPVQQMGDLNEEDCLVCMAREGNERAVLAVWETYRPYVRRFVRNHTRNEALVEDVVSETLLKALNPRTPYKPNGQFRPWLKVVAQNFFQNKVRVYERDESIVLYIASNCDGNYCSYSDFSEQRIVNNIDLAEAMKLLPEKYREVIVRYEFYGQEVSTIAQVLGIESRAVYRYRSKALAMLRSKMAITE